MPAPIDAVIGDQSVLDIERFDDIQLIAVEAGMSLLLLPRVEQPAIAAVSLALELIQGDEAQ